MSIRLLPSHVINRIRAGEVIERPAQVVKELVENAIDAGAKTVHVSVSGNKGIFSVGVSDDGAGMGPQDLELCVLRHATSKLKDDNRLDITALGFRGEALAAIGAVAKLQIISRTPKGDCAWSVRVENGVLHEVEPAAGPVGTTVFATGIFELHPARAAFLKTPRWEKALIRETLESIALATPGVGLSLKLDDRQSFTFKGAVSWEARVSDVLGHRFIDNSLPFEGEEGGVRVKGRVGHPSWNGHSLGHRIVVNGRPIKDKTVASALKGAFAGVSKAVSPAAVVDISVPAHMVDVNAHPMKSEVRFSNPELIHKLIRESVSKCLGLSGPIAAADLSLTARHAARPLDMQREITDRKRLTLGQGLGMVMGTYAVCARHDGLVLVDIHAAHERLVLEKLKKSALAGTVEARNLLTPIVVEVGLLAATAIEHQSEALGKLGLKVSSAADSHVIVSAIPSILYGIDAVTLVRSVAARLADDPLSDPLGDDLDRLCSLFSCHAAVRAGDELSEADLDLILREIESSTDVTSVCNHGRPTAIHVDRSSLKSLFMRD